MLSAAVAQQPARVSDKASLCFAAFNLAVARIFGLQFDSTDVRAARSRTAPARSNGAPVARVCPTSRPPQSAWKCPQQACWTWWFELSQRTRWVLPYRSAPKRARSSSAALRHLADVVGLLDAAHGEAHHPNNILVPNLAANDL